MPDYKQGRIYKIVSPCGLTYYGSTTQRIWDRMAKHISNAKMNKGKASQSVIEAGGEIYLVEMYPCNSEKELHEREGWYIRYRPCVNEKIAGRPFKEYIKQYRENNREQIAVKKKEYYENNKENIRTKQKQPYNCECGSTVRRNDKARHFRSQKHRLWVENNQN